MKTPTVDAFRDAFFTSYRRFRAMDDATFARATRAICEGARRSDSVATVLSRHAREGSIDAAAALLHLADFDSTLLPRAKRAIANVARRSADIGNELLKADLARILHEQLDAEVAAGLRTVTVDPATGEKRYGRRSDGAKA